MARALGPVERIVRGFTCPRCQRDNGDPCVTRTGNRKTYAHSERWWQAHNDEALPYQRLVVVPGATGDPATCRHAWDGDPHDPQCGNGCGAEWEGP